MGRRSKRKQKTEVEDLEESTTGRRGGREKEVVPTKKNTKKEEKVAPQGQNADVEVQQGGNNIKSKRGRGKGSNKDTVQHHSEGTKSFQSENSLANARTRAAGIKEIMRKANLSTLSSYKIPKKPCYTTLTIASCPVSVPAQHPEIPVSNKNSVSLSMTNAVLNTAKSDNDVGLRKRKSIDSITPDAKRDKRYSSAPSPVDNTTENASKTEVHTPLEPVEITPNCRPKLIAKRSKSNAPDPSVETAKVEQIDTPQMALLRDLIANKKKNKNKKVNSVTVHHPQQKQREQHKARPPLNVTPSKTLPAAVSSLEPASDNWSPPPVENIPCSTVVSSKDDATNVQNLIPQSMQPIKSDAGNNFQADVFDEMDVDMTPSSPTQFKQLLVIFDTNVWIDRRNLIQQVLDMEITFPTGSVAVIVVIPWMVLQEIDRGKVSNSSANGFRNASKYIHSLLAAKHPRVKGQKATEAVISMEFNELMADDSILNCAVQCSKLPQFQTVLVTNDVNFLNKALVHNLNAFKADNGLLGNLQSLYKEQTCIISELEGPSEPVEAASNSFLAQNSFCASPYPKALNTPNSSVLCDLDDIVMDVDDPMGDPDEISNRGSAANAIPQHVPAQQPPTFEDVAKSLQQALTTIIVPKMIEDYGLDGWKYAIKIKPPFTIESGLKCIEAHWIAVFSYLFSPRGKTVLDELLKQFQQKPQRIEESKQWRLRICQLANVLLSFNTKLTEKPLVSECCRRLQNYIQYESMHAVQQSTDHDIQII